MDFCSGPLVKNLLAKAGDKGSIPGPGTKILHALGQLSTCPTTTELMPPRACAPKQEKPPQ